MSTPQQIAANQANAEKSTGPKTEGGKAASSRNSWQHGLTFGVFRVLATENQAEYDVLQNQLIAEYSPATPTEAILVERMAQHHWMRNRALYFQSHYIESGDDIDLPKVALFMRYETTHERAFHKCLNDLTKLRSDKQKQEIGFASHTRKQELHEADLRCHAFKADYEETRISHLKCDIYCQEKRLESTLARENRETQTQIAA